MAYQKFTARLSRSSLRLLMNSYNFLNAVLSGFWLGVLSEKSLDLYDELHYNHSEKYFDDNYNRSGLSAWEKERVEKYFPKTGKILLIAAGGGRETLALSRMGFEVESYECNKALVEYGNQFLNENNTDCRISYLAPDSVPSEIKKYDGIIMGWGAYSHIRGARKRLSFLTGLYAFMQKERPLMISFLIKEEKGRQDRIVENVSCFFRMLLNRDKTEPGDRLLSYFIHYFTEKELKNELVQSGYRVTDFYNADYGCVIAELNPSI